MNVVDLVLHPPVFEDEDKTRSAALLHFILILTIVSNTFSIVGDLVLAGYRLDQVRDNIITLVAQMALLIWMRKGGVRQVGFVFASLGWLVISYAAYSNTGILNPIFGSQALVVLIAGLLVNEWVAVGFAALSTAFGLWLVNAAESGQYVNQVGEITARHAWVNHASAFVITALLLWVSLRAIREVRNRAKHNAMALQQSEARYRALVDNAPSAILMVDRNHRISLVSRTPFGREQFAIGHDIYEYMPAAIQAEVRAKLERVFREGTSEQVEVMTTNAQGEPAWYSDQFAPIWDGDKVREVAIIASNITQQKRVETELRHSEALFSTVFQAVPVALSITSLSDGHVTMVNDFLLKLTGYERDELIGTNNLKSPLWYDRTQRLLVARLSNQPEGFDGVELQWNTKSGEVVSVIGSARQAMIGGEMAVIGMAVDISERKLAEEALRRSESLLSKVFELVPVAIAISTLDEGKILTMNSFQLELLGYESHAVLNHSVNEIGYWADMGVRQKFITKLREDGYVQGEAGQWKTRDGDMRDMLISFEPIDIEGQACVLVIGIDITELKRADEDRLEAEKLRFELEKEREVLVLKDRFISTMSHEFRTPLAVIMAAKESLEHYYHRMKPERRTEHFANIAEQILYLTNLLDEILTVSKARAGKMQFQPTPLNLTDYCRKVFEQMQTTDKGRHQFSFASQDMPDEVEVDKALLQHILINLLSNAVKYSPAETNIALSLARRDSSVMIQVHDQGIGIPELDQQHLFEPFYRASNVHSFEGTGLGLAIVKESAEAHGGSISCKSGVGQGTTFTVCLPLKASVATA